MPRLLCPVGAVFGLLSVALGAFGAQGLKAVLALTGTRWLGAITPLEGLAFIVGWAAFAIGLWKEQP